MCRRARRPRSQSGPKVSVSSVVSSTCISRAHSCLSPPVLDCSPILSSFQVILLEHIIMCRLVTGHKATALQEVRHWRLHTQNGKAEG